MVSIQEGSIITEACKSWGKPEPFYRIRANEVMIGFNTNVSIAKNIVDNIVDNVGVNTMQIKVMELMQANPKITAKLIAQTVGIAPR